MNDQLPPSDIDAEKAVIGTLLANPELFDVATEYIDGPEDFYAPRHAEMYQGIVKAMRVEGTVDPVLLTGLLADSGAKDLVGKADYLIESVGGAHQPVALEVYAKRVGDKALARRVIEQQEAVIQSLYNGHDPGKIIDSSINGMIGISKPEVKNDAPIADWIDEAMEKERPRVNSGLYTLDEIVGGFEMGTMTIVGARPSMGKTAFGVCLAHHLAATGVPTGFISAEMKGRRIGRRIVCTHSRLSTEEFEKDKFQGHVQDAVKEIKTWPLYVDQTSGMHVDKLCGRLRRWHREHGIKAVVVDYLQLLSHGKEDEYNGVTYASKMLKSVAQELDIALFVLAQLNRQNTQRTDKKPTMADLRGSGAVEQDADVILLLHRDSYYDPIEGNQDEAQIIVEKSRDGRTGTATTGWVGKCGVFTSGLPEAIGI